MASNYYCAISPCVFLKCAVSISCVSSNHPSHLSITESHIHSTALLLPSSPPPPPPSPRGSPVLLLPSQSPQPPSHWLSTAPPPWPSSPTVLSLHREDTGARGSERALTPVSRWCQALILPEEHPGCFRPSADQVLLYHSFCSHYIALKVFIQTQCPNILLTVPPLNMNKSFEQYTLSCTWMKPVIPDKHFIIKSYLIFSIKRSNYWWLW